jgi:transposase
MDHFAGMDVSVKETSVGILDDAGKISQEVKVASEPQALLKVLGNPAYCFKRIGLEAGPFSLGRSTPTSRPVSGPHRLRMRAKVAVLLRPSARASAMTDSRTRNH